MAKPDLQWQYLQSKSECMVQYSLLCDAASVSVRKYRTQRLVGWASGQLGHEHPPGVFAADPAGDAFTIPRGSIQRT